MNFPNFPKRDVTDQKCFDEAIANDIVYIAFEGEYILPRAEIMKNLLICYYLVSALLASIGVYLIYLANRKIALSNSNVTENWSCYVVHLTALFSLAIACIICMTIHDNQYVYTMLA